MIIDAVHEGLVNVLARSFVSIYSWMGGACYSGFVMTNTQSVLEFTVYNVK